MDEALLVMNVGNGTTVLGVFRRGRLLTSWRIVTRPEATPDEYRLAVEGLLAMKGVRLADLAGVAVSSVVPALQRSLKTFCTEHLGHAPLFVDPAHETELVLRIDSAHELGPDRYVNAVAARRVHGVPVIVADLGTATTFNCVNARGEFVGGAIAPGLRTCADALTARAARLVSVELELPARSIGTATRTALQSGLVYGYAGLVDGLVQRMRDELGERAKVVATGSLAPLVAQAARSIDVVDPQLTLIGLEMLWQARHRRPAVAVS